MTPSNDDRTDNVVPVQGHDAGGRNGNLVPMDLARAHVPPQLNGWHGHTPVVPAAISMKPDWWLPAKRSSASPNGTAAIPCFDDMRISR